MVIAELEQVRLSSLLRCNGAPRSKPLVGTTRDTVSLVYFDEEKYSHSDSSPSPFYVPGQDVPRLPVSPYTGSLPAAFILPAEPLRPPASSSVGSTSVGSTESHCSSTSDCDTCSNVAICQWDPYERPRQRAAAPSSEPPLSYIDVPQNHPPAGREPDPLDLLDPLDREHPISVAMNGEYEWIDEWPLIYGDWLTRRKSSLPKYSERSRSFRSLLHSLAKPLPEKSTLILRFRSSNRLLLTSLL